MKGLYLVSKDYLDQLKTFVESKKKFNEKATLFQTINDLN